MSEKKISINEEILDQVVGGFFSWNTDKMTMKYSHPDGSVTTHKILDLDKAWERSNLLHAQKIPEDDILKDLISKGYIQG